LDTYHLSEDGSIERRHSQTPSITKPPPISVSVRRGINQALACRLLRQLADELERQQ
jgi:hypothetical protein